MTITDSYLEEVLSYLRLDAATYGGEVKPSSKTMGGYEFPCPFCASHCDKDRNKRKRVAVLLPHAESHSYTFYCHRNGSCNCSRNCSFPNFLAMYKPALFRKYQQERFHAGTTGKGHNIANPDFSVLKKSP